MPLRLNSSSQPNHVRSISLRPPSSAPRRGRRLWRVPVAGGQPEQLTTPDRQSGETDHTWPQFLPSGTVVLFRCDSLRQSEDMQRVATLRLVDLRGELRGEAPEGASE